MRRAAAALLLALAAAAPARAAPVAPAFTLRLLDSRRTFDSRDAIEKTVLVVRFQASWCKPCAREAPELQRLYERYRPLGVEVVGVQVQDTAADARRFLESHGAKYPAGLDPRLKIANRFGATGTPYTVVISRAGRLVARIPGESAPARLPAILDLLTAPPRGRSRR
jgi:cytochrome c biogenesis protein CcmG/thiol:disulfide interchange protein DsbE